MPKIGIRAREQIAVLHRIQSALGIGVANTVVEGLLCPAWSERNCIYRAVRVVVMQRAAMCDWLDKWASS